MPIKRKKTIPNFLGLEKPYCDWARAKFVVLPVPYEHTVTYGRGTGKAPKAIIKASKHVETFDEELKFDVAGKVCIYTEDLLKLDNLTEASVHSLIEKSVKKIIDAKKIPVILGGEHSISAAAVKAAKRSVKDLSVLQIDAHADLRDSYMGTRFSHASVMRRILEVSPAVQVGIRNISEEGYRFAKKTGQLKKMHAAKNFGKASVRGALRQLSKDVYVTIDVDGLDPSVIPITGTPEPGGLGWYQVLSLLREVAKKKNIVGFDLVELAPQKGMHAADFASAKLIYKLMGYIVGG